MLLKMLSREVCTVLLSTVITCTLYTVKRSCLSLMFTVLYILLFCCQFADCAVCGCECNYHRIHSYDLWFRFELIISDNTAAWMPLPGCAYHLPCHLVSDAG